MIPIVTYSMLLIQYIPKRDLPGSSVNGEVELSQRAVFVHAIATGSSWCHQMQAEAKGSLRVSFRAQSVFFKHLFPSAE